MTTRRGARLRSPIVLEEAESPVYYFWTSARIDPRTLVNLGVPAFPGAWPRNDIAVTTLRACSLLPLVDSPFLPVSSLNEFNERVAVTIL